MASRPRFAPAGVDLERRADGSIVLRSPQALAPPARALGEWLVQWAARAVLERRAALVERLYAEPVDGDVILPPHRGR